MSNKRDVLTRQEIINEWNKNGVHQNALFCCPTCRDILTRDINTGNLYCDNDSCLDGRNYTQLGVLIDA